MARAHIAVETGYERLIAQSDGANPVVIPVVDINAPLVPVRNLVNAFALKDGVIDPTVEITINLFNQPLDSVTFTPPDSDARWFVVIVMG
jgi:hypothetical protein